MQKTIRFTIRVDPDERRLISALAKTLRRNASDTVRQIIHNAAAELDLDDTVTQLDVHIIERRLETSGKVG